MLKEQAASADFFTVLNRTILTDNDRKLLIMLYQPIIGSIATSLYFVLWSYLDKNEVMSVEWTHHHLITSMRLKLEEIIMAREKLEAIGLLKSYVKRDKTNHYVYELYSPLEAIEFFQNPVLGITLYHNVGKSEFEKIKEYFKIPKINLKGYEDITCHFGDIFEQSDFTNYESLNEDIKTSRVRKLEINSKLDINQLLESIDEDLLNIKSITPTTKNFINNLAFIYNLNESTMSELIISSLTPKKTIDKTKLKEQCLKLYQFEHNGTLPSIAYKKQPEHLRKNTSDTSKKAKLIYQFETTTPYEFLLSKNGGKKLNKHETEILSYLLIDLELNPGVVNVILDYILKESENRLIKSYVEIVASQFARNKIKTVEEAMNLASLEHKNKHKIKEIKESKKEVKPVWFDKKIEEKEASQKELQDMENLLSKYK